MFVLSWLKTYGSVNEVLKCLYTFSLIAIKEEWFLWNQFLCHLLQACLGLGFWLDAFVVPFVAEASPLIQAGRGCLYEAVRELCCLLSTGPPWGAAAINVPFLCQAPLKLFSRPSLSKHVYKSTEIRSRWRLLQEICHWPPFCSGRRELAAVTDVASYNHFPCFDYLGLNLMRQVWARDKHNQKSSTESQDGKQV